MTLLAKSNGTSLKEHSDAVSLRCAELAAGLIPSDMAGIAGITRAQLIDACQTAGRFHDIGKALPYFQDYLKRKMEMEYEPTIEIVDGLAEVGAEAIALRFHNEFSWLALEMLPELLEDFPPILKEAIKNAVYWHHGAASDYEDAPNLLNAKDENGKYIFDLAPICDYLGIDSHEVEPDKKFCTPRYVSDTEQYHASGKNVFLVELNAVIFFIRMVLIRADREVSGHYYGNESVYTKVGVDGITVPESYGARFITQKEIIKAADRVTNMLAAPAGFGKTLVGILWSLQYGRPVMWVCPRNVVIDSVYEGLADLDKLLGLNLHVSKVYSGEETSFGDVSPKAPHIIVTNIDAITQPMASQKLAGIQYEMIRAVMVFDEYHEILQDNSAMYAAYGILTFIRGAITMAPQMFLSATPVLLERQVELDCDKLAVLPGKDKHFDPQHDKIYHIHVVTAMPEREPNMIRIYNVVDDAQKACSVADGEVCIHSKYTDEDRASKMDKIYASYGKGATGEKFPVCSGPILRASADISFQKMAIMCSSPNNDVQCIGRCDRWGEYDEATVYLVIPDQLNFAKLSKANQTYIKNQYSEVLYGLWVKFVHDNFNGDFTLKQIYALLDKFNRENSLTIKRYNETLFGHGLKVLGDECYPHRPVYREDKSRKSAKKKSNLSSGGTIRNPDPSLKYIVLGEDRDQWFGPFSVSASEMDMDNYENLYNAFSYRWENKELRKYSDKVLVASFPRLAAYIGEPGQKGDNKRKRYLLNKSFYRSDDYPYIVHPTQLLYSHEKGIYKNK